MAALTGALLALTAANTIGQAIGQHRQGEYAAHAADVNAGLAQQQAADALTRGQEDANRAALGTRQLIGAQRGALAASGVDVGSGTAVDLQADAAGMGALDRLHIIQNAQRQAFGYQTEAAQYRDQAAQTRAASRAAVRSTLLTGAARAYGYASSDAGFSSPFRRRSGAPAAAPDDWAD